jgi:hypothetical protein
MDLKAEFQFLEDLELLSNLFCGSLGAQFLVVTTKDHKLNYTLDIPEKNLNRLEK